MSSRRLWAAIEEFSEEELRLQVVIPLLRATPGISSVTDVHGSNERGLDVIFTTASDIEEIVYGLQLKQGTIGGGGTSKETVKQIVDQLGLADDYSHPITTKNGEFTIDRFVVATSGKITGTARDEITRRLKKLPVLFWDGNELGRRIHQNLPQLFAVADGESVAYLKAVRERYDALDSLDQIPGVAKRTLSQIYVPSDLRRKYDPGVSSDGDADGGSATVPALKLLEQNHRSIVVGDQDSGKTSLLRMLAISQADYLLSDRSSDRHDEPRACHALPVLIRAKDVLAESLTIVDGIAAEFRRIDAPGLVTSLPEDLKAGNYFLLIDGFSDLVRDEDKELLSSLIEAFTAAHSDVRVVVAGRDSDFLTPMYLKSFQQYSILEFTDAQIRDLTRRWTKDSASYADLADKMIVRLREALQLPGSPIPATIGVMIHEEHGRYITNTAEAIERYMVIRLGRYAHELGVKQQLEWTRKQDLLAEVAYEMIENEEESLTKEEFIDRFNAIVRRLGEKEQGDIAFAELSESGVLVREGTQYGFHRTSFRDFFAGHHLFRSENLENIAVAKAFDRRWGGAIVFAAGLRRTNSKLLGRLAEAANREFTRAIGEPSDDYYYCGYLCGRVLSNSESADKESRIVALQAVLTACARSIPGIETLVVEKYGPIGRLLSLIGAQQTFFGTVGVPWLQAQLRSLVEADDLTDEERCILASTYTYLGYPDAFEVLESALKRISSLRVTVALDILVRHLSRDAKLSEKERAALFSVRRQIARRLAGQKEELDKLLEIKSKVLELERKRMRRIMASKDRST